MSVDDSTSFDKPNLSPQQIAQELQELSQQLQQFIPDAAARGDSFDEVERKIWESVRQIGFQAMELFLSLQGQGDIGQKYVNRRRQEARSLGGTR